MVLPPVKSQKKSDVSSSPAFIRRKFFVKRDMKRFYKDVGVNGKAGKGYAICLDKRPVKTPAGRELRAPGRKLAKVVAAEWAAQEEAILPGTMPLTQLLITALDRVADSRTEMEQQVLDYLDTDLVCYRAGRPDDLAAAVAAAWDPWCAWFEKTYGTKLKTTTELAALVQPSAAHRAMQIAVADLDDMRFTALQMVTATAGSLVLALAFVKGALPPGDLFDAIHVEEQYKAALYREDVHGPAPQEEKKQQAAMQDLTAARTFLDCL